MISQSLVDYRRCKCRKSVIARAQRGEIKSVVGKMSQEDNREIVWNVHLKPRTGGREKWMRRTFGPLVGKIVVSQPGGEGRDYYSI